MHILSHKRRHTLAEKPTRKVGGRIRTRIRKRMSKRRRLARWPAMVAALASGANTDSTSWTGTKTHLQKMVCVTPTHRRLCTHYVCLFVPTSCLLLAKQCVPALRYCAVCGMSQLVAQQLCTKSSCTHRRPIVRLGLWDLCDTNTLKEQNVTCQGHKARGGVGVSCKSHRGGIGKSIMCFQIGTFARSERLYITLCILECYSNDLCVFLPESI